MRRISVSQGVHDQLVVTGEVVDPGSGYLLRLDQDSGEITVHHPGTGVQLDIPTTPPRVDITAARSDPLLHFRFPHS